MRIIRVHNTADISVLRVENRDRQELGHIGGKKVATTQLKQFNQRLKPVSVKRTYTASRARSKTTLRSPFMASRTFDCVVSVARDKD